MNVFDQHMSRAEQRTPAERVALRKKIQEQQNPTVGSSLCILMSFGTLAGLFVWYSWWNPDVHDCYYSNGSAYSSLESLPLESSYIEVSKLFRIWCIIGLVICSFVMSYSLMGFIFYCTSKVTHAKLANCFLILGFCLAGGWLVFGTVIRFRTSGIECSGQNWVQPVYVNVEEARSYSPYLIKTGKLIGTLIIMMYCFYGCLLCCGCCACGAVACGYRRELS